MNEQPTDPESSLPPQASNASPNPSPDLPASCPRCGTATSQDSAQGLCPRCLMEVGIGTQPGPDGVTGAPPKPVDPAELAAHFPQLEVLDPIGQGGMGIVYRARQRKLDRLVALKILPRDPGRDPAFAERFHREARALARLNHPNIITVYDFGEIEGLFYLVMEYVDGADLRRVLQQGRLGAAEALRIVPVICDALQYAHANGVVHRDIKPGNILLDRDGRVKIADFGIAKLAGAPGDAGEITLTQARQSMGTPHYMAPEQVECPRTVDHRADIYSLGVVFYEMLTGELPLGRFAPPSRRVEIDVRLDEVVLRALEKDPGRRYQQVGEVKTEVERISAQPQPQSPTPASGAAQSSTAPDPAPWLATLGRHALALRKAALVWAALLPLHFQGYNMLGDHPVSRIFTGVARIGAWAPLGATVLGLLAVAGETALRNGYARMRNAVAAAVFLPALAFMALAFGLLISLWIGVFRYMQSEAIPIVLAVGVLLTGLFVTGRTVLSLARRLSTPGTSCRRWWFAGTPLLVVTGLVSSLFLSMIFEQRVRATRAVPNSLWSTVPSADAIDSGATPAIDSSTGLPAGVPPPPAIETPTSPPLPPRYWEMTNGTPRLTARIEALLGGQDSPKARLVNAALEAAWTDYRNCLRTNLTVTTNAQNHLVAWSPPMPDAMNRIEADFFNAVDPSLTAEEQNLTHLNLGPQLRGRWVSPGSWQGNDTLFVWGDLGCVLEFWRVGQWYHWRAMHGFVTPQELEKEPARGAPNQGPDLGDHEILAEIARTKAGVP